MKTKLLAILLISVSLFFNGCDEDSIAEAVIGSNSITLSGEINKSFDADCITGMTYEDSTSDFVVIVQPKNSNLNSFIDKFALTKKSDGLPAIGKYDIGDNVDSEKDFLGFYSANDTTIYAMYSGSIEITESSTSKIAGTFELAGYYGMFFPDSTRTLNITGKFSAIPINLN